MIRLLIALFVVFSIGTAAAQESYEERWIRLADESARAIAQEPGKSYATAFAQAHAAIGAEIEARCARSGRRSGMASFQAVAVLDASGNVLELLNMPRSKHLDCFADRMVGRKYPAPPTAPFYQVLRFALPTG